jgi:RNA polymerase sigma-70 factor (ECF subfamily)
MDKQKFNLLIAQHQQRVYSLALYILRDQREAEDLTQEVFTTLWKKLDEVTQEIAQQWLTVVTRNRCIDKIRCRKEFVLIEEDHMVTEQHQEPGRALELNQLSKELQRAIQKLKEPYSSLIALCDVKQHSQQTAADLLSLSVNQVKVYLHRARAELRNLMQESIHE